MSDIVEQLLELAQKQGAQTAEVYQVSTFSRPVSFETNRLKQLETNQSEGCALRLWRDGCPGLAVAYGIVEPEVLVAKALAISQLNPPETPELADSHQSIYPTVGKTVEVEKLIEIGKETIVQIRDGFSDVICGAELECEEETTILANSQGLYCQYTDISLSYFLGVEWVRGENFLGIYDGECSREKINPEPIVKQILQKLTWAKSNTNAPSGKLPVILTPNVAVMFWSTLAEALNGKTVIESASPWSNRQGKKVISDVLTLSQKPDFGPYSCPCDDEGTPTQNLSLIQQGYLKSFYCDRTIAKLLETEITGNGFRPHLGRYPTPDLVNLIIEPGESSFTDLISQIEDGIIIDQTLGGGADISGDFSINIDLGYRVKKGEIIGRIKDTMIAGNVYEALNQVVALGNDLQWQGSCYTPSIIVGGLSIVTDN